MNHYIANYVLFTKFSWPGDSEGTFRSSSQAATCLLHTAKVSHCLFLLLTVKQGSFEYQFFVFSLTRPGIELESTISAADTLSTQPLINDYY